MLKRLICRLLIPILLLSMLTACNDTVSLPEDSRQVVTQQTHDSNTAGEPTSDDTVETVPTEKDTPLVTYTLKHHITDLTAQMPESLLKTIGSRYSFISNGKLYFNYYSNESGDMTLMLLPVSEDGVGEAIRVPDADGHSVHYAYPVSNDCYVLIANIDTQYMLCVTDSTGAVLASAPLQHEHNSNVNYHISEDDDGNLYILSEYGTDFRFFYYDAAQNVLTMERFYRDDPKIEPNFGMRSIVYLGNRVWLGTLGSRPPVKLDMNRGALQKYPIRLPGEEYHYSYWIGGDKEAYFLDKNGLYQYRDNAIPVQVLDYDLCSLGRMNEDQIWVVDETHFFILTYQTFEGVKHPRFCTVQTEYVPDTDSRPYIEILSYSKSEWLTEAVNRFNAENPSWRVKIQYVDVRNRDHEDLNAELQEKILYQSHPDILVWGDSPWRPLDKYYDKNTFLDLMPHFGNQLLGCVRESASYGDALYSVPTDLWLQTFVCSDDITDTFLTWDTFFDVIDRTELPAVLTSEPMAAAQIWDNGIMDFCDFDAMTSYYNTEQFRNMVSYCYDLEHQIYEEAGRIAGDIFGAVGYTNATLPARLADGGLAFLTVPVEHLNHILAPMLLYGDADFTWCGYPSREGGGAYLNMANHQFSVFSDTDLAEGCIAFLSLLLSDEEQSDSLHPYLPVTESGMRRLIQENRYFYYETQQYQKIGDPNAAPTTSAGGLLGAMSEKVIYLTAQASASVYYEDYGEVRGDDKDYTVVELTDDYAEAFLDFLNNCHMKAGLDLTLKDIITEELSYWQNDARTLEETTKIIDSRVWIYLNE